MARVLIVDDNEVFTFALAEVVASSGHEAVTASTLAQGQERARARSYDVVYLDVVLPDGNGLAALPDFAGLPDAPEVIIITASGSRDGAEMAIRDGAWDYIEKSSSPKDIQLSLLRVLEFREKKTALAPVRRDCIVGRSAKLEACIRQMGTAARSMAPILLLGETGTGKELFARAVHENSPRAAMPFVVVDCAAIQESLSGSALFGHRKGAFTGAVAESRGLIQQANGGTLFLDEVSELALETQKKFLRVLETSRFCPLGEPQEVSSDFRLISASNRDLAGMVREGRFRADLFFRIQSVTVCLPPLRERRLDLPDLVDHFLVRACTKAGLPLKSLSPELMRMLGNHAWPGNVRELSQVIEALVASAPKEEVLMPWHLPRDLRAQFIRSVVGTDEAGFRPPSAPELPSPDMDWKTWRDAALARAEAEYLQSLAQSCAGDLRRAMAVSGLSQSRLYGLLKKHGLRI